MGISDHDTTYMRVGGDDGELRLWHYTYVYSIESTPKSREAHRSVAAEFVVCAAPHRPFPAPKRGPKFNGVIQKYCGREDWATAVAGIDAGQLGVLEAPHRAFPAPKRGPTFNKVIQKYCGREGCSRHRRRAPGVPHRAFPAPKRGPKFNKVIQNNVAEKVGPPLWQAYTPGSWGFMEPHTTRFLRARTQT